MIRLTPAEFQTQAAAQSIDVSRETLEQLQAYAALLEKWQPRINLVSRHTLSDLWRQHILDSAGLLPFMPQDGLHVDLGSGAGFPGLVLSILGSVRETILIESDQRKAAFLQEVIRQTNAPARVMCQRIETAAEEGLKADVITARALAPLHQLLDLAVPLGHAETLFLFPKGQNVDVELTEASKCRIFTVKRFHGIADERTTVLRISHVTSRSAHTP